MPERGKIYILQKIPYIMVKTKIREIEIKNTHAGFTLRKSQKKNKKDYNFESLSALRQLLNNEKARILNTIKTENPESIYDLSKKISRNFKSVFADLKLLERFGFVDLIEEKVNNRKRLKPVLDAEEITINIKI